MDEFKMTKILFRNIRWLRGILATTNICNESNDKEQGASNRRLLLHVLVAVVAVVPQVAYMFLQSVDVLDRVKVFYQIVGALGVILQSILLVSHRKEIKRLLADMQRFISLKNVYNERRDIFNITEAKVTFYSKVVECLAFISYLFYTVVPVIPIVIHAIQKRTTTSNQPNVGMFKDLYFFNASRSPMRELCYITQSVGLYSVAIFYVTIGILFCGLCLYIVAMYIELQNMLEYNNRDLNTKIQLCDCIEYQLAILKYGNAGLILSTLRIFSRRIFPTANIKGVPTRVHDSNLAPFFSGANGSSDIFSTIVRIITQIQVVVPHLNRAQLLGHAVFNVCKTGQSEMLKAVLAGTCITVSLLIYCWFGQLVVNEETRLQITCYELRWYDFDVNEQKMLKLMILRTQKPSGLAAFNYFKCDLPTFFKIMTNVYSMVSFLLGMV